MRIKNAYQNNLRHINLDIPEHQLIVLTGLSGSGKSSLAMDIIANEGRRYFLESLPAYNQQNGHAIPTAEVDDIEALPPVIRVEQSKKFQSIKTTFGTLSELSAVFRVLFARYAGSETMSKSLFSFNHPKGACERCRGIGEEEYIDVDKLIGDESKTLREGAITTTLPQGYIVYSQITVEELNKVCQAHGFSVDIPWRNLTTEQKEVVLNGSDRITVFYGKHSLKSRLRWSGLKAKPREEGHYKGMLPIMKNILRLDRNKSILRFTSARVCPDCHGGRIKPDHLKYRWKGLNFKAWQELPLSELYDKLTEIELTSGERMLVEKITVQLRDLIRLGMQDYRLSTPSAAISSGDAQRLKLVKQVNSSLQGILYVFDEPSIGLPETYQQYLYYILSRLIQHGNSVMVVEHDLNFIRSADWIVELGPGAGGQGGEVIFNGQLQKFLASKSLESPTLAELRKSVASPGQQKAVSVQTFQPELGELTVVNRQTPQLKKRLIDYCDREGISLLRVSDRPIGKTPRSNPATYTGLAVKIRNLLAKSPQAKTLGVSKSAFSFNNKRGRCETCEGAGVITLSLGMMGAINQSCPSCNGKRFKPEVLQVNWNGKTIADIYDLSVIEALRFFKEEDKITKILEMMYQLGLGYLKLGQASNTLSGGEAQRIKLTKHFAKQTKKTLLVLEEPSIGLHQQNVRQLLKALHSLKRQTAGILCFEHHVLFESSCDTLVKNGLKADSLPLEKPSSQRRDRISIRGARTHHLNDLSLDLPKQQLSVITGVSGSGKSSLLINTLQGYGLQEMTKQFSTYQQSRVGVDFQFEVDHIEGLTPTICVTRKEKSFTKRSDIATQTGIDKVLRFAFSRKAQYEGDELSASHFSNKHDLGKCAVCDGLGEELLPDLTKIVCDETKSIAGGLLTHNKALAYYGQASGQYMAVLKAVGAEYGLDLETPFNRFTAHQKSILFEGARERVWKTTWEFKTKTRKGTQALEMAWKGLFYYLKDDYYKRRKNKNIKHLKALFKPETCSHCEGSGLKPERLKYRINGESIGAIKAMDFQTFEHWLAPSSHKAGIDQKLIARIYPHCTTTIQRARQLHLTYLQLNRKSATLSGGENQRIALIKQLNSPLKGITYLLDEPSAGLSMNNIPDLINILRELIRKGNTVIVIEHNKEIILAADQLIELGPKAGKLGGEMTFYGKPETYVKRADCHPYLKTPSSPTSLKPGEKSITIRGLSKHKLQRALLDIYVGGITAISGKSGVGKTTLVKEILIPSIQAQAPVNCKEIDFPQPYAEAYYFEPKKLHAYADTLLVDYLNLLNLIGKLFAKHSALKPRAFSYKTTSSQCANCKGKGYVETSLDVVANAIEPCVVCKGQRYQDDVLSYKIRSKNIAEVLALDIAELQAWLTKSGANIPEKTQTFFEQLKEIGLGHLRADQPVKSLSSGEKQRLLLLNWLQPSSEKSLYILDEPSTGLHYADIDLLLIILRQLSVANDVLIIDHNPYLLQHIGCGIVLE